MLPFEFDCSPALAEVMLTGRATLAGVAATWVRLASQGWVVFSERDGGRYGVRLRRSAIPNAAASEGSEGTLLRWLHDGAARPDASSGRRAWWPEWWDLLGEQAVVAGAFTTQTWRSLRRWQCLPPLAKRLVPAQRREHWQACAERLKRYPMSSDPLPNTREEWDTVFTYAIALGQARAFLRNAREVCEYYERHFEGIVITFFTPPWYLHREEEGQARFAFLTGGLADLVAAFRWDKLDDGKRWCPHCGHAFEGTRRYCLACGGQIWEDVLSR